MTPRRAARLQPPSKTLATARPYPRRAAAAPEFENEQLPGRRPWEIFRGAWNIQHASRQ